LRIAREYAQAIGLAVFLALVIRGTAIGNHEIPSGSMLETLQIGDRILVNKLSYSLRLPFTRLALARLGLVERGDVVVFEPPFDSPDPFIKRVIGLPGDVIWIVDKRVFVNGQPLEEPYISQTDPRLISARDGPRDNLGPLTIPPGKLFLIGDHRDNSFDSRFWGPADEEAVLGRAVLVYWSWDRARFGVRWSRILTLIQ